MAKGKAFAPEFRQEAVRLYRVSGRPFRAVAEELGVARPWRPLTAPREQWEPERRRRAHQAHDWVALARMLEARAAGRYRQLA